MIYSSVIYVVASSQCNSPEIESSSTILEVWSLWPPWQQELLENYKNWFSKEIFIFHLNIYSPPIPCPISLFFFSIHDLKLKTNEFVYDGMICFPLNPYHWHVVLFTGLPTPPRFGFCMHNFWISPMDGGQEAFQLVIWAGCQPWGIVSLFDTMHNILFSCIMDNWW